MAITISGIREYHQTHLRRSCMLGQCSLAWVASKHSGFADSAIRVAIPWDSTNSMLYSSFIQELSFTQHLA